MFVLHVALQGCLRARNVEFGITADTGGHIRYLLELIEASSRDPKSKRIVIATRRFKSEFGKDYACRREVVSDKVEIVRLDTRTQGYLEKERLYGEIDSFAEALVAFIEEQPAKPDFLHAHYADAASIAALVEDRLGIPFVFTAHSLGLVKADAIREPIEAVPGLLTRIASEETAMRQASLIIASSRDEAEMQWSRYSNYDPGRIRILPPGSDLGQFANARSCETVDKSINRFLTDPSKPAVLALARPVRKKNLASLVRTFGENTALRARANLVLVAGTRDDYRQLDGDMADTFGEILRLIDRYDLYGSIAYPKTHRPEDVPAIYAYARDRGGVFVNPAFNEPFGLTLLEAAAVGLPLIATDSGGPNDIIEMCGNGILVDPRSTDAIGSSVLRILGDQSLWDRYSKAGACAVEAYDWTSHVTRYHGLLDSLRRPPVRADNPDQLLICDIDNTLIGCKRSLRSFGAWCTEQRRLAFGVATGRSFHSAMSILEQQDAPRPHVMITSVGSEIYHLDPNGTTYSKDQEWRALVAQDWETDAVTRALAGLPGILPQSPLEQRTFKLSYFSNGDAFIIDRVRQRLERAGLRCSVIHSHGRYLDILPHRVSKGTATHFVRDLYGLPDDAVFVAGDSGNDIEMLRTSPQAIIVGNFSDNLPELPALKHSYVARETHALGIIEGVTHFRNQAKRSCKQAF